MENTTRISFSAVTHIGVGRAVNEDRIYANGKFHNTFDYENSNISLDINGNQFIFALSDGMESGSDSGSKISINEELKKFHQKSKSSLKDIRVKLDEMADCVQQSSNLLYSLSLGEEASKEWAASFAGIIIDNGSLAAVNLGTCKIFRLEGDNLRLLMDDHRKTERLLKMGIISNEQAELISGQIKSSNSNNSLKVKKSDIFKLKEDSLYLLCSDGLLDAVSEDTIYEVLAENRDTDKAAGLLVNEAVENGGMDNITAIVIRIEKSGDNDTVTAGSNQARRVQTTPKRYTMLKKNRIDMEKLVKTGIMVAVIAVLLYGGFQLWKLLSPKVKDATSQVTTQQTGNNKTKLGSTVPTEASDDEEGVASSTEVKETIADADAVVAGNAGMVIDENTVYVVKAGDNLLKISEMYYGDEKLYEKIVDANNIKDPKRIQVGQKLKIPPLK